MESENIRLDVPFVNSIDGKTFPYTPGMSSAKTQNTHVKSVKQKSVSFLKICDYFKAKSLTQSIVKGFFIYVQRLTDWIAIK